MVLLCAENTPAPGFRHFSNGTLNGVGHYECIWSLSASASSSGAHNMHFYNGGLTPQSSGNRTYGHPVRCLQE